MAKTILPIVAGTVIGASVGYGYLQNEATLEQSSVALPTADISASSESAFSASPGSGDSYTRDNGVEPSRASTGAAARREAALARLAADGYSAHMVDEIAATLPPIEAINFRIEALVALSTQDPERAISSAINLPDAEQRRLALRKLAQALAGQDPAAAIAGLDAIESAELKSGFMEELLDSWSIADPDQLLAFLENPGNVHIPVARFAFDLLADRDPERLLSLAAGLSVDARQAAMRSAFGSFIEQDPLAALARAGDLAPGSVRSSLQSEVPAAFGEKDPDAAWRWANESDANANVLMQVLLGIQNVDPERALNLALAELASTDSSRSARMRQRVGSILFNLLESGASDDITSALDRILSQDISLKPNVQQFVAYWSDEDPVAALDWSLQNLDRINQALVLGSIGRSLARIDPERVRQALYELPLDQRAAWVSGVAETLGENDLAAARDWALDFPRGPLRDAALHEYVNSQAHGGSVDVQLFDQFSRDEPRDQAAREVAFTLYCDGQVALAFEVVGSQVADPDLRAQTEQLIRMSEQGNPIGIGCELIR